MIHSIRHTDQPPDATGTEEEGITPRLGAPACPGKIHEGLRAKPADLSTEPQQPHDVAQADRILEVTVD